MNLNTPMPPDIFSVEIYARPTYRHHTTLPPVLSSFTRITLFSLRQLAALEKIRHSLDFQGLKKKSQKTSFLLDFESFIYFSDAS